MEAGLEHDKPQLARVVKDKEELPDIGRLLRRPGLPIEPAVRQPFESQFSRDFSTVRVHSDEEAARAAQAVGARAFTVGRHVFMGADEYLPATAAGQRLIAHELTHVAQQAAFDDEQLAGARMVAPDHPSEHEARSAAGISPTSLAAPAIQRDTAPPLIFLNVPRDPLAVNFNASVAIYVNGKLNYANASYESPYIVEWVVPADATTVRIDTVIVGGRITGMRDRDPQSFGGSATTFFDVNPDGTLSPAQVSAFPASQQTTGAATFDAAEVGPATPNTHAIRAVSTVDLSTLAPETEAVATGRTTTAGGEGGASATAGGVGVTGKVNYSQGTSDQRSLSIARSGGSTTRTRTVSQGILVRVRSPSRRVPTPDSAPPAGAAPPPPPPPPPATAPPAPAAPPPSSITAPGTTAVAPKSP